MQKCLCCIYTVLIFIGGCTIFSASSNRREYNEAVALFNNNDCEKAMPKFTKAVQKEPGLLEAYVYMAECVLKKGDFKEALRLARQGVSVDGRQTKVNGQLKTVLKDGGQKAFRTHDYEAAILLLEEAVALDQADSSTHLLLGKSLLARADKGDMKAALTEFKAALKKSSQPAKDTEFIRNVLFERAEDYSAKGDLYAASRCYLAYTENFNPKDVEACIALGHIFLKIGNPVGALYYAQKAHDIDPQNKAAMELLNELNGPIHP